MQEKPVEGLLFNNWVGWECKQMISYNLPRASEPLFDRHSHSCISYMHGMPSFVHPAPIIMKRSFRQNCCYHNRGRYVPHFPTLQIAWQCMSTFRPSVIDLEIDGRHMIHRTPHSGDIGSLWSTRLGSGPGGRSRLDSKVCRDAYIDLEWYSTEKWASVKNNGTGKSHSFTT
jgi:hypothetical protein